MQEPFEIIDISQPVYSKTACFPGDTPFSRQVTVSYQDSQVLNLSAFTMSPHIGTHADAPNHIQGDMMDDTQQSIGHVPLKPYIGPCRVIDVSPLQDTLTPEMLAPQLPSSQNTGLPPRLLFKTARSIRHEVFESRYASFSEDLIHALAERGVLLMGIDTPSVDPVDSKTLPAHHALLRHGMGWLENLDLTQVTPGDYFLSALPLKMLALEASPVRAVLIHNP